jgi:hypothetical protein
LSLRILHFNHEPNPFLRRFAQPETRAAASAARGVGETHHISHVAVDMNTHSNVVPLWEALKTFFKDNPGWE